MFLWKYNKKYIYIYKVIKFNGYGSKIIEILKRLEYQDKVQVICSRVLDI